MFEQKGVVTLKAKELPKGKGYEAIDEDALLEASLEAGAESYELLEVEEDVPGAEVFIAAHDLEALTQTLTAQGYTVTQAELRWIPSNSVEVTDPEQARSLLRLMDALEELDDVQSVTANFEMAEELMSLSLV